MKKTSNNVLIVIIFFTISLFSACSDKEDEITPREEKMGLLAGTEGRSWILQSATAGLFDITQFLSDCELDNLYILYPTGEGEYASGEEKCNEGDADILETGAWAISEDAENLDISLGMITNSAKILALTNDRLQLEFSYDGQVVVATFKPEE